MPSNILDEIVSHKKKEVAERKSHRPLDSFKDLVKTGTGRFQRALSGAGLKIVAEIKPKSPSAGTLRGELDVAAIVATYDKYASAISVLADKKYFDGSIELLQKVAGMSEKPVLCKDFIIDPYQCFEARRAGAEAMLLIVKALDGETLRSLHDIIQQLGMTAIVEIQNEEELERALAIKPSVIMINNRDLRTLDLDLNTTKRLAPKIPTQVMVISASGIQKKKDIELLSPYCQKFLVGSSLMQSKNIDEALSDLLSARIKACQ